MEHNFYEYDYLCHHGVLGMKWGVRRYQNTDGSLTEDGYKHYAYKNLSKARTSNLDKWGKSSKTNTLYIAGYSGSGKSTTAKGLAGKNDQIINLDFYSEPIREDRKANKEFDDYLDKKVPKWREMANNPYLAQDDYKKKKVKDYWKTVDALDKAIDGFSEEQFKKGKKSYS